MALRFMLMAAALGAPMDLNSFIEELIKLHSSGNMNIWTFVFVMNTRLIFVVTILYKPSA